MVSNNAIASTQQKGEGDAFIFDNAGANRNIGLLAKNKADEAARAQQEKLAKQKQDHDDQKQFIDNLSSINTLGIRSADLPIINADIDGLLKSINDAKMQGKNPLDMSNIQEYMGLQTSLGKLQAKVDASKTWQKQLIAAEAGLKQDRDGKYDFGKTMNAIQTGYTKPFDEMVGYNIEPVLADFSITPRLDKIAGDNLKGLFSSAKTLYDQGAVDKTNEMLTAAKQPFIQSALSLAQPEIAQGRITPEKVIKDAGDYFDYNAKTAVYDPTKANALAFQKTKEANLNAYRAKALAIQKQRVNAYDKKVNYDTTVQDYGTNEFVNLLEDGTNESDTEFKNAFLSSANGLGVRDIVKVENGKGKELFITVPFFDNKGGILQDDNGQPKTQKIFVRNEQGGYNKDALANSSIAYIYEANQKKNGVSPVRDLKGEENSNVKAGTKTTQGSSTSKGNSTSSTKVTPQKTVVKKGYNSQTNQTQFIYSDGTKEIVNGKH